MSKVKVAISEVLESGEWMSAKDIAAKAGFSHTAVKSVLCRMCTESLVATKEDPDIQNGYLYKKGGISSGFGIGNIALFDRLIREVRA